MCLIVRARNAEMTAARANADLVKTGSPAQTGKTGEQYARQTAFLPVREKNAGMMGVVETVDPAKRGANASMGKRARRSVRRSVHPIAKTKPVVMMGAALLVGYVWRRRPV